MTQLEIVGLWYPNSSKAGNSFFLCRTDNHIKNHFHSKLRKGIRKLNKEIKTHFKKTIKPFKINLIYKVVEASDYRFSENISQTLPDTFDFNQLKNFLL